MDIISGKWSGEFVYGNEYEDEKRGKRVKFFMTLFYDYNIVHGISMDDEAKEIFREPAKIEGSFENDVLIFYLTYSKESVIGVKRNAADYGTGSIQYIGHLRRKLFTREYYFKGIWEINESHLDSNGEIYHSFGSGTWKMRKVK